MKIFSKLQKCICICGIIIEQAALDPPTCMARDLHMKLIKRFRLAGFDNRRLGFLSRQQARIPPCRGAQKVNSGSEFESDRWTRA